jgi:hypothetical protein
MSEFWGWDSKADFVDYCRQKALDVLITGDRLEAFLTFVHYVEKHPDYHHGTVFDDIRQKILEGRGRIINGQLSKFEEMNEFLMEIR